MAITIYSRNFVCIILVMFAGCAAKLSSNGQLSRTETETLIARADSLFNASPKRYETVAQAYQLAKQATSLSKENPLRYQAHADAALYSVWLALNDTSRSDILAHASEGMNVSSEATRVKKDGVEGYYYRAIATGLFAEQNKAAGRSAMTSIRADGERAAAINPKFDHGGPHRLLGALYLRAPGAPAGIGSLRKAIEHLEAAHQLAPDYPENMIFLAEAYSKVNRYEDARKLVLRAENSLANAAGNLMDRKKWQQQLADLKARLTTRP
jgi:tetratricopeptide (TPR) repeat protein